LLEHIIIQKNPTISYISVLYMRKSLASERWDPYVQSIWCHNSRKLH